MGTKLPRKLEQKMQIVGEQIKLARLRRNLSVAQIAERATCSPLTVSRIEKGSPTVSIGIYLLVLYALNSKTTSFSSPKTMNWVVASKIYLSSIAVVPPRKADLWIIIFG